MLVTRGYEPAMDEESLDDLTQMSECVDFDPTIVAVRGDEMILVIFNTSAKVGIDAIRGAMAIMNEHSVERAILVVRAGLTSHANKLVKDLPYGEEGLRIEHFREDELLFDIARHYKTPPHRVLTPEEKCEFLSRYRITDKQMCQIQCTDAMARYLGLVVGDVVQICQPTPTGIMVTHRVCVDTE